MKIVNLALGLLIVAALAGSAQGTIIYYGSGGYYPSYGAQVSVGYYAYPSYYGAYYNYGYGYPYYGYGYYNYPYYNYGYYPYYGYSGYTYGGVYCQTSCHWVSGYCYC